MPATYKNLAPSGQEGSGTIQMGTWNILNWRGRRLKQAAAGLAQLGIGMAVLTETKFVDNWHPKTATGYAIMFSMLEERYQQAPHRDLMSCVSTPLQIPPPISFGRRCMAMRIYVQL